MGSLFPLESKTERWQYLKCIVVVRSTLDEKEHIEHLYNFSSGSVVALLTLKSKVSSSSSCISKRKKKVGVKYDGTLRIGKNQLHKHLSWEIFKLNNIKKETPTDFDFNFLFLNYNSVILQ